MDPPAGLDGHGLPGARVSPGTCGVQDDGKRTKPRQRDCLALSQGFADDRVKGFAGGRMGPIGRMV